MITPRDKRQEEFSEIYLANPNGILYLCPRFGKIRTSLLVIARLRAKKILVTYPLNTIKDSWESEIALLGCLGEVEYVNNSSLYKLAENPKNYDLIIVDEIHTLSEANIQELKTLMRHQTSLKVLGLTGTLSAQTAYTLRTELGLPVLATYDIETAIREKVVTDYEITVVYCDLDDSVKHIQPSKSKKFFVTERQRYDYLTDQIDEIREECESIKAKIMAGDLSLEWPDITKKLGFLPIYRKNLFRQSIGKLRAAQNVVNALLKTGNRILVFAGSIEAADSFGIPSYHSKNKNEQVKNDFCRGDIQACATVDMFEAGVTVKPIKYAIMANFDSNPETFAQRLSRVTGFEYDTPNKVARIIVICTTTQVEKEWLQKALGFFDPTKIKYITTLHTLTFQHE